MPEVWELDEDEEPDDRLRRTTNAILGAAIATANE